MRGPGTWTVIAMSLVAVVASAGCSRTYHGSGTYRGTTAQGAQVKVKMPASDKNVTRARIEQYRHDLGEDKPLYLSYTVDNRDGTRPVYVHDIKVLDGYGYTLSVGRDRDLVKRWRAELRDEDNFYTGNLTKLYDQGRQVQDHLASGAGVQPGDRQRGLFMFPEDISQVQRMYFDTVRLHRR